MNAAELNKQFDAFEKALINGQIKKAEKLIPDLISEEPAVSPSGVFTNAQKQFYRRFIAGLGFKEGVSLKEAFQRPDEEKITDYIGTMEEGQGSNIFSMAHLIQIPILKDDALEVYEKLVKKVLRKFKKDGWKFGTEGGGDFFWLKEKP